MVTNPLDYVEPLGKAGASGFTFHVEAAKNWDEIVQKIKAKGMKPGVSLKPGTPIEEIEGENPVELVLVMTVEPGFGGQKFMPEMMDKVRTLRQKYPSLDIELVMQVDGGLGPSTIDAAASAGANCIVAGSSVFGAPEPAKVISLMRNCVEGAQKNS
ncbi:Ribulose-phosphate 3-epimerase, cytoplasmic isoform [Linum perenne]